MARSDPRAGEEPILYPTKTRLALLRAVDTGHVLDNPNDGHTYWTEPPDEPFRIDARIREAERAGWIALADDAVNWRLTETGQAVLADA